MALQTREQHIRREKATSNVCTAQALLANVASMYAVYHGPRGIRAIAESVHGHAVSLAAGLKKLGVRVAHDRFFDTVRVEGDAKKVGGVARRRRGGGGMNLRRLGDGAVCIALDETTAAAEVDALLAVFNDGRAPDVTCEQLAQQAQPAIAGDLARKSAYLTHPVFNTHHSETEMLRYIRSLEERDISLVHSMIPLGSCTMKLNATAEMMPVTWMRFGRIHPFAPVEQAQGYQVVVKQLEAMLAEITGFPAVSLQPNSGAQGEFAGLLVIRKYHETRGEPHRDVCLIPASAHGTNPASAAMAGMRVVVVACDEKGNIDLGDLEAKAREHAATSRRIMITYPSTYGIFEEEICASARSSTSTAGRFTSTARTSTRRSVSAARPTSGPTSATSTCTRPSASRTAAAARAWGPSASRRTSRSSSRATRSSRSAASRASAPSAPHRGGARASSSSRGRTSR